MYDCLARIAGCREDGAKKAAVSGKDREKIESDLLAMAAADAKRQAQHLAKGFEAEIDAVFAISGHGFSDIEKFPFLAEYLDLGIGLSVGGPSGKKELIFVPSTITFKNRVQAIFKLKMKD